jgi:hypothetical protein
VDKERTDVQNSSGLETRKETCRKALSIGDGARYIGSSLIRSALLPCTD